jgi:peroxiredoxin
LFTFLSQKIAISQIFSDYTYPMSRHIIALSLIFTVLVGLSPAYAQQPAPNFRLPALDDKVIDLADYRGKVVYVDFWATWCPPCRKSFPWMEAMHQRYQNMGFAIVAISLDQERELINEFLQSHPASFTIVQDSDGASAKAFKVRGMPSSYLIDQRGNLRLTHEGFSEGDKYVLEKQIKKLLAE